MLFIQYDQQRSFPEYVDMEFKRIVYSEDRKDGYHYPLNSTEQMLEFVIDGYFPEFCELPDWFVSDGFEFISRRRIKKVCKKIFDEYGDIEKACSIIERSKKEMRELYGDGE